MIGSEWNSSISGLLSSTADTFHSLVIDQKGYKEIHGIQVSYATTTGNQDVASLRLGRVLVCEGNTRNFTGFIDPLSSNILSALAPAGINKIRLDLFIYNSGHKTILMNENRPIIISDSQPLAVILLPCYGSADANGTISSHLATLCVQGITRYSGQANEIDEQRVWLR